MSAALFASLIKNYGILTGLGSIPIHPNSRVFLSFDSDFNVDIQWHDKLNCIYLSQQCIKLPDPPNPKILREILAANFLWRETGGATLSLDTGSNTIYLMDKWNIYNIKNATIFSSHLDGFVDVADFWRQRIQSSMLACSNKNIDVGYSRIQNQLME